MIDSLSGVLVSAEEDFAVIDVHGIRFRLDVPASTARGLPAPGVPTALFTRLSFNANDGEFALFGFATETERNCFDIFTGISGIGPRKGLMILSQIEIAPFARAIVGGDLNYLSRIKGVGKKTAERLVVELRDKMAPYTAPAPGESSTLLPASQTVADAVQALMVLGCRPAVAEKAIGEALKELGADAKTEELIRVGLRHR